VGFKDQWKKIRKGESDITRDEFMKYVVDLWTMPCARNADHPAVFSEELPYRAIKLFSYIGDTILDPFVGSGTTMKVACRLRRNVVGIDKEKKYCNLIRKSNWFYQSSLSNDIEYIYEEL
jgi:site-specific DNA-methyltransferase (adenine-specific)